MNKFIDRQRQTLNRHSYISAIGLFLPIRDHTLDEPEIPSLAWTARDLSGKFVISRLADRPSRNIARPAGSVKIRFSVRYPRGLL